MAKEISKSQIDRLGERLKLGKTEDDLRLLEQYRHSFRAAHEIVYKEIREKLLLEPTKRRTKTTQSIVDKLLRESIRLTQIQDIAGCRIVATHIADQDEIIEQFSKLFDEVKIIDRREKPSHGYRAIHVIVFIEKKAIEIQVRTALQQLWAELSEKFADMLGQDVKYGGGLERFKNFLIQRSLLIKDNEYIEGKIEEDERRLLELSNGSALIRNKKDREKFTKDLLALQQSTQLLKQKVSEQKIAINSEMREILNAIEEHKKQL